MRASLTATAASHLSVGDPSHASTLLARLPHGTRDWKRVLSCLIALNNRHHARRDKRISFKTMEERAGFLYRFFGELRGQTEFENIDPRCLKPKHIQAMVERWVERDLSTGTIHNYISYLHTFALWIDKAGLVQPVEFYVGTNSGRARRSEVATRDKSWSGNGVDFEQTLNLIRGRCPYVAIEIEFGRLFGLRAKETIMLRPHEAVASMPASSPPDETGQRPVEPAQAHYLLIRHGAKGGRKRDVLIESATQWELVRRARAMVSPGHALARTGYTLKQNLQHYFDVLKAVGVTQAQLGVTGHGLRHERAGEDYQEMTGAPPPVRGGAKVDPALDRQARDRVAAMLGHGRRAITCCYLGKPTPGPAQVRAPASSPAPPAAPTGDQPTAVRGERP